ncbi:MAG: urease accessory protein UreE [Thermodesulfobacteriota bacterium]
MEKPTMIQFVRRMEAYEAPLREEDTLVLPYALRQKTRQRVRLLSGREAGILLARGTPLRPGDRLGAETGECIRVRAADEPLSVVAGRDPLLLMRIAYHLGNRHVPLQIEPERLIYLHDPVLDDMVRLLGVEPIQDVGPFEPEEGAYHDRSAHVH